MALRHVYTQKELDARGAAASRKSSAHAAARNKHNAAVAARAAKAKAAARAKAALAASLKPVIRPINYFTAAPPAPSGSSPDELARHFDQAFRRIRIIETHMLGIPFSAPPAGTTKTLLVNKAIPSRASGYPGPYANGLIVCQSGAFTIVGAGTTVVLEAQFDGEMEAWDNTIAPPRRDSWADIPTVYGGARQEWPFGPAGNRVKKTFTSASLAIAAGNYTARAMIEMQAQNGLKIYGGYLRVTWTH